MLSRVRIIGAFSIVAAGLAAGLTPASSLASGLEEAPVSAVARATGVEVPAAPLPPVSLPAPLPGPVSDPPVSAPARPALPPSAAEIAPAPVSEAVSGTLGGGEVVGAPSEPGVSPRALQAGQIRGHGEQAGDSGGSGARTRSAPASNPQEEQRTGMALRRAFRDLGECVTTLPATERRVVILRANPGAGRPRTRTRVAGVLQMSAAAVGRIEHHALADLRRARQSGTCAGSGGSVVPAAFVLFGAGSDTTLPIRGDGPSTLRQRVDAIASAALRGARVKFPPSPRAVSSWTGTPLPAATASSSPTTAHRRAPGGEAERALPQWLAVSLLGMLALALVAFLAYEIWATTTSRRRWQYRRALRRRVPPLAPAARARSARESEAPEPAESAPTAASAEGDRPSRWHGDRPPRRRRRGPHDRSLRS